MSDPIFFDGGDVAVGVVAVAGHFAVGVDSLQNTVQAIVDAVWNLEKMDDTRALLDLLRMAA